MASSDAVYAGKQCTCRGARGSNHTHPTSRRSGEEACAVARVAEDACAVAGVAEDACAVSGKRPSLGTHISH